MSEFSGIFDSNDDFALNQVDSPAPEGLKPLAYWIHVMPIAPRKVSPGGIILSDGRRDAESFMNNIGRIVAMGPSCFLSSFWRDRGVDFAKEPHVKPGDFVRYSGARNRAFYYKGVSIVEIEDIQLRSIVDPAEYGDYRFWN